ncbi:MAG: metalloregulator ArsR/SmtB family transcription factor [Dehalococcoidales bacterium]|nr:metalloregulator ArsR/SmtB family transcription factor [Dehalococcoidales bacterium]
MIAKRDMELYKFKAAICKSFADPKRLVIIEELREGQKSVSDLIRILAIPQAAVSRHLAVLREKGIVDFRRQGTSVFYSLTDPRICEACDLVHSILLTRLEKNHKLIEKEDR